MSNPLVSIVGPTATGKSSFALSLAEQVLAEKKYAGVAIISADSRQVYQGLEVVSGADIPPDFARQSYDKLRMVGTNWSEFFAHKHFFQKEQIELHGLSLIRADQEWSLAHFQRFALAVIYDCWQRNVLPLLVGGTGLYHTRLFAAELQDKPGPNQDLRQELAKASLVELQERLKMQAPEIFTNLTDADRGNPRRIIRALERVLPSTPSPTDIYPVVSPSRHQILGLTAEMTVIESNIAKRVAERLANGALQEVQSLVRSFAHKPVVFTATGVKEIHLYIQEKIDYDQLLELWIRRERQYAKRQLTWWKKYQPVQWLTAYDEAAAQIAQDQLLASL